MKLLLRVPENAALFDVPKPIPVTLRLYKALFIIIFLLMPLCAFSKGSSDRSSGNNNETPVSERESEIDIEELRRKILGEAPSELFNFSLGDSNVSLFLTGSWRGELTGNLGFTVSPAGTAFSAPQTPLLFKQEVDLGLSLWINDKWFVEANILDDYKLNTYRAGYQGFPGEFVQYAGIGNTGLDFPSFAYMDLGGDSTSSFGFYSHLARNNFAFHALVRYDTASNEERTFIGGRERIYSDVQPQNSMRASSFILPDDGITAGIIVYIEDESGSYRDGNGRRWRQASSNEYAVSGANGFLEFSVRPNTMIAVSYSKNLNNRPWLISMGSSYSDTGKYLNTVQEWFGSAVNLASLTQCGGGYARPGEIMINGSFPALVIYEPGAFSPFERRSRYEAPLNAADEAALVWLSTGMQRNDFELIRLENSFVSIYREDPFSQDNVNRFPVYELVPAGASGVRRSPQNSWPLAKEYPEIYLPSAGVFSGDITLRFINYNSVSGYYIGTDIISGSVQVYRSGIQDTGFYYNPSSGEVSVNGPVGRNELIRITYMKKSGAAQAGSIAAGLGMIYSNDSSPFSAQAAAGVRWNVSNDSFTEANHSNMGSVGISAKAALEYDYLKAHLTGGFNYLQTDTTGLYRAAGMEGNETVYALPPESSFISNPPVLSHGALNLNINNRADLIYRNYNDNNIFNTNFLNIETNVPVVSGYNRPYPANDSQLNTRILAAEFVLNSSKKWTGFQVPVIQESDIFSRAQEIEIPFRLYGFASDAPQNLKIIIQIGALSGSDFAFTENIELVWEKTLYSNNQSDFVSGDLYIPHRNYTIARFKLSEEDKRKLGNAKFIRLIAVYEGSGEISGRVLLAPPIIRGAGFRGILYDGNTVTGNSAKVNAVEVLETDNKLETHYGSLINRLHSVSNTQRVLRIGWNNINPGVSAGVDGRVGEIPLSDYQELSFFLKKSGLGRNGETLSFIIASGPESISAPVLKAALPLDTFVSERWSKITIRYQGSNTGVYVDGVLINRDVSYKPQNSFNNNISGRSSYMAILVSPYQYQKLDDRVIHVDEIILEDAINLYRINAGAFAEYSRPGTLLSAGSFPLFADLYISTALESETGIISAADKITETLNVSTGIINRSSAAFSIFNTNIKGNLSFNASQDVFLWNADHDISRSFGPFFIRESFFASPQTESARHGINLSFQTNFYARFDADAIFDLSRLRQRWNLGTGYRSNNDLIPAIALSTEALWTRHNSINKDSNYGELWINTLRPLVPDLGREADSRRTQSQIAVSMGTKPVGAALTLDGRTNFTGANNVTQADISAYLDIPVVIDRTNINFRLGRSFTRQLNYSGSDVMDDGRKFLENAQDWLPFLGAFPFYSLFTQDLNNKMDTAYTSSLLADEAFYTAFNDHFSIGLIIPSVYNLYAFLIPSRLGFRLDRALEQKMDTRADSLEIGASAGFTAMNMFGVMGYSPVFKFYQTDEYYHSIDAAVSIPLNDNISWRLQSVFNAGFRGFSGGLLELSNRFTLRSGRYWSDSITAGWEIPTNRNLLSVFYDWVASSIGRNNSWPLLSTVLSPDYEQLRRVTMELSLNKSDDYLRWSVIAGHEEIIRILGRLNFTTFIKLRFSEDQSTSVFSFDTLLGTNLRLMF